jgi:predicted PurR-regulated permease PerM
VASNTVDSSTFTRRVLFVLGAVLLLVLMWHLADVLVLVFGATVVAVALRALAARLEGWHVPPRWSLVSALLLLLAFGTLVVLWIGDPLAEQLSRLREGLPAAFERVSAWLRGHRIGVTALEYWASLRQDALPWSRLLGVAGTALGALGTLTLIVMTGVYLAADPKLYRRGVLSLLPPARRAGMAQALDRSGDALRHWLMGQSLSMLFVGGATALGLLALSVPLALAIGLISGLLAFIPFFGALVGGGLAVLVAFMEGPQSALHVLILCIAIQQVEGHVLMPLVQRWAVSLPPVLGLMSTLIFGVLFGVIGVLFATPMMVVVVTLVQCLHVERLARQAAEQPGNPARRAADLPPAADRLACRPNPTAGAAAVRSAATPPSDGERAGAYLES